MLRRLAAAGTAFGYTVGRKDHGRVRIGDFVQFLHKHGAFGLEGVNDEPVVHDLVAHVDRRAVLFERQFDDPDRAVDAGAEAAGAAKYSLNAGF